MRPLGAGALLEVAGAGAATHAAGAGPGAVVPQGALAAAHATDLAAARELGGEEGGAEDTGCCRFEGFTKGRCICTNL